MDGSKKNDRIKRNARAKKHQTKVYDDNTLSEIRYLITWYFENFRPRETPNQHRANYNDLEIEINKFNNTEKGGYHGMSDSFLVGIMNPPDVSEKKSIAKMEAIKNYIYFLISKFYKLPLNDVELNLPATLFAEDILRFLESNRTFPEVAGNVTLIKQSIILNFQIEPRDRKEQLHEHEYDFDNVESTNSFHTESISEFGIMRINKYPSGIQVIPARDHIGLKYRKERKRILSKYFLLVTVSILSAIVAAAAVKLYDSRKLSLIQSVPKPVKIDTAVSKITTPRPNLAKIDADKILQSKLFESKDSKQTEKKYFEQCRKSTPFIAKLKEVGNSEQVPDENLPLTINIDLTPKLQRDSFSVQERKEDSHTREKIAQDLAQSTQATNLLKYTLGKGAYMTDEDIKTLKKCIDRNAQANVENSNNRWTALHAAAYFNCYALAESILKKNIANINAQDKDRATAIWYAADRNSFQVAELLLNNGADPNVTALLTILKIPSNAKDRIDVENTAMINLIVAHGGHGVYVN